MLLREKLARVLYDGHEVAFTRRPQRGSTRRRTLGSAMALSRNCAYSRCKPLIHRASHPHLLVSTNDLCRPPRPPIGLLKRWGQSPSPLYWGGQDNRVKHLHMTQSCPFDAVKRPAGNCYALR